MENEVAKEDMELVLDILQALYRVCRQLLHQGFLADRLDSFRYVNYSANTIVSVLVITRLPPLDSFNNLRIGNLGVAPLDTT